MLWYSVVDCFRPHHSMPTGTHIVFGLHPCLPSCIHMYVLCIFTNSSFRASDEQHQFCAGHVVQLMDVCVCARRQDIDIE